MNMPQQTLRRLIQLFALLIVGLASGIPGQARQANPASQAMGEVPNGRTAMSVRLSQDGKFAGALHKADGAFWVESDASGKAIYRYTETKRDDGSIYLADSLRGVKLQLDLSAGKATYINAMRHRDFYEIQSASTVVPEPQSRAGQQAQNNQVQQPAGRQIGPLKSRTRDLPARDTAPAFCWNDATVRGAGTIPGRVADCPAGYTNSGAACTRAAETIPAPSSAPVCPAGYSANGSSCERPATTKANANSRAADCPDRYTNTSSECFRLSASAPLPMSSMTCNPGETKVASHCYKACESGYVNSGASCVRPVSTLGPEKMSCKAGYHKHLGSQRCIADCADGYTSTGDACSRAANTVGPESMSCKAGETRSGGRCIPASGMCAKGEVQQGGLCYTACAAGFDGVGTACFASPHNAWVQCAMGSAKDAQACAAAAFDQLTLIKQMAVSVGMLGGTGAASGAAQKSARLASMQKKFKELNDAYNKGKDSPTVKSALDAWEKANPGKDAQAGYISMDKMATATTEDDMMRYAAQWVTIVGPDSGSAAVDASAYPKCSKLFPAK